MLAAIIVGYNSRQDLKECFDSLQRSTVPPEHIIFIDYNSTDDTVKFVSSNYKDILLIASPTNLGFAKANNLGFERALALGATKVLLINPDVSVEKDCIKKLLSTSESTIIQPTILLKNMPDLINTAGNNLHFLGFSYCGHYKEVFVAKNRCREVVLASGAVLLIPVKIVQKIGLFDDKFFLYHEDVDFSWRARIAGYSIACQDDAVAFHRYNFSRNNVKMYYAERNRWLFVLCNYQAYTLFLLLPALLINETAIFALSVKQGWYKEKIRGYFDIIYSFEYIFRKRKKVKEIRKRNDKSLLKYFSFEISFAEQEIPFKRLVNYFYRTYWYAVCRIISRSNINY